MARTPDLRSHATHDLELIAAHAAGDAAGSDLATAMALVAGCPACAALHHDLRAIAAALPELPAPVRPRSFTLTPEQAAALRPAGWRRFAAILAGPRFRFAAPFGTGLATLGLAGLLLGVIAGAPLGAGTATSGLAAAPAGAPAAAPSATAPTAISVPSAAPAAVPSPESRQAPGPGSTPGGATTAPAPQGTSPAASAGDFAAQSGETGSDTGGTGNAVDLGPGASSDAAGGLPPVGAGPKSVPAPVASEVDRGPGSGEILLIAGGAALVFGSALVALRWGSRRLA